jgi:chromate transporter
MKELLDIYLTFFRVGISTFGGGYAMIPVVERELINKKGWVTMDEVMNYYTIAQITPGIIAVNLSTFVGYKLKGPLGGIISTLGFITPGVVLISIIAAFISNFMDIAWVGHAFAGIRIAVGALILETVWKLVKNVFKNVKSVVIYLLAFFLAAVPTFSKTLLPHWASSPMLIVLAAGVIGFLIFPAVKKAKAGEPEKTAPKEEAKK